ncbi:hypothetical protein D3C80_1772640 [compost metagenome]
MPRRALTKYPTIKAMGLIALTVSAGIVVTIHQFSAKPQRRTAPRIRLYVEADNA